MSETTLFPRSLALYVVCIRCLITVSITFMVMHGLRLMTPRWKDGASQITHCSMAEKALFYSLPYTTLQAYKHPQV